jgi:hypothetical protein
MARVHPPKDPHGQHRVNLPNVLLFKAKTFLAITIIGMKNSSISVYSEKYHDIRKKITEKICHKLLIVSIN